jgi:hypothetical protein
MKCARCPEKRPSQFGTRPNGNPQPYCRKCTRAYNKRYYKTHKADHNGRRHLNNTRRRKELSEIVTAKKHFVPCTDCRVPYPHWQMQFDHLRDKHMDISSMVLRAYSLQRILDEIAKCEIVCANCHADRTYKRRHIGM